MNNVQLAKYKNKLLKQIKSANEAGDAKALNVALKAYKQFSIESTSLAPVSGRGEAMAIGAGRTLNRLGAGVKDLYAKYQGDEQAQEQIKSDQAEQARLYSQAQKQYPFFTGVGESLPYVATGVGAGGGALTGATKLATGAARAAAGAAPTAFVEYAPTLKERGMQAGIAAGTAAAAYPLARAATRLMGGVGERLDDPHAMELVGKAKNLGFKLLPSSKTGSGTAEVLEQSFGAHPGSAGLIKNIKDHNQKQLVKIASEKIGLGGQKHPRLDRMGLGRARTEIGDKFQRATAGETISLDDTFRAKVLDIADQYNKGWGETDKFTKHVKDALTAADKGGLVAEDYHNIASRLTKSARAKYRGENSDPNLGDAILALKEALDDAAERALPPEKMKLFKTAREQYRNLMTIEQATDRGTGELSGAKLVGVLGRRERNGFGFAQREDPLYDAADVWGQFKSSFPVNQSATAEKQSLSRILGYMSFGATGFGAAGTAIGGPVGGVLGAGLGATAGALGPPLMAAGAANAYLNPLVTSGINAVVPGIGGLTGRGMQRAAGRGMAGAIGGAAGQQLEPYATQMSEYLIR